MIFYLSVKIKSSRRIDKYIIGITLLPTCAKAPRPKKPEIYSLAAPVKHDKTTMLFPTQPIIKSLPRLQTTNSNSIYNIKLLS